MVHWHGNYKNIYSRIKRFFTITHKANKILVIFSSFCLFDAELQSCREHKHLIGVSKLFFVSYFIMFVIDLYSMNFRSLFKLDVMIRILGIDNIGKVLNLSPSISLQKHIEKVSPPVNIVWWY